MPKKYFFTLPLIFILSLVLSFVFTALANHKNFNDITKMISSSKELMSSLPQSTDTPQVLGSSITPSQKPTVLPTETLPSDSIIESAKTMDKWIYYPVNKTTVLSQSFVPNNLVSLSQNGISTVSTSYQMRKEVITDLKSLFTDAKSQGINLKVTSPYRSYATQVTTFNYWKSLELKKGLTDAQATIEANKSSAIPGQSEHQLGTACDVISSVDSTLDETVTNKKAWDWMDAHLIEHGFVLSFPDGKEEQTGYITEPWHIRWVGKDMAKEIEKTDYLNPKNNNTETSYIAKVWDRIK